MSLETVRVVLGSANKSRDLVKDFAQKNTQLNIHTYEKLSSEQMAHIMSLSQIAIVPASSILYEVISVKMPVICGYYVDNQINVYKGFKELGLIYGIGDMRQFKDYITLIDKIKNLDQKEIMNNQNSVYYKNPKKSLIQNI